MSEIPISPAYLGQLALALALAITVAFVLQSAVALLVRLFFRIPITVDQWVEQEELREHYRDELDRIEVWDYLCSMVGLVSFPALFIWAARWLILGWSDEPRVLIHTGALVMAIPLMIAGAISGSVFVKGLIQSRFAYPQSAILIDLYVQSEDAKYGYLGRILHAKGGAIAAAIIVATAFLAGNHYSVISKTAIDVPNSLLGTRRLIIPLEEVERLVELRRTKKNGSRSGPTFLVFLVSGDVLSSSSVFMKKPGVLADVGNSARKALPLLSEATGVPVEAILLQRGQQLSDYDADHALGDRSGKSNGLQSPNPDD